jgi:hypothetical protein
VNVRRWWLAGILFFIPFQHRIFEIIQQKSSTLATSVNRLDEITLIIFLPFAIRELYKNKSYNIFYFIISFPVLGIIITGLISGLLNGNLLLITIHGIFEYVKSFFIIFIYAAFFREIKDFKNIFLVLLIITVVTGVLAFVQELWVIYSRYLLDKDIHDPSIYLLKGIMAEFSGIALEKSGADSWRFGLYRASSLFSHSNLLGLFSLFILTFYLSTTRKINLLVFLSLFAGIFVSISRVAYAGFMFMGSLKILKFRRALIITGLILLLVLYVYMIVDPEVNVLNTFNNLAFQGESTELEEFRRLAMHKSMEVWKDHPVWGVGPGMFGGAVALKNRSSVYEEYNFFLIFDFIYSLDQFWPQVLAEMGIIGTVIFTGLLISLIVTFLIIKHRADSDEVKGLFHGLAIFTVILFFYTFGGNLNNVSILYPYCAFIGIGLGCSKKNTYGLN